MASKLKTFVIPTFKKGYNSYTQSKSMVEDQEIPYGNNVYLDDNGSATKRSGKSRYGVEIVSGKAVTGMGWLHNPSHNKLIVSAGTSWYQLTESAKTTLTGKTFTDNLDTDFVQAIDRLYGANGTDNLCYTTDGSTVTEVTSNGNVGRWPCFYNQRLYMTNSTYPDRIYYSNPLSVDLTTNPPTLSTTNFGTFNTDLSASPKKTAGWLSLLVGGGVEITRLYVDGDFLYAYTKNHGLWKIGTVSTANDDGSIAHTISQVVTAGGSPSGRSVTKVGNDQWFYGGDNMYTLGEVAQFQNIRVSTKSGRVKSEMNSIATSGKTKVASGFYRDKLYVAYQTGSNNDKIIIYDTKLNAWSCPISGISVSQFLEFEESDGTRRFLAASADPDDSYVYEIETGTSDNGAAIEAVFETKSTDCGEPGLVKRIAFIDVFYAMVYGTLTYQVFIDEVQQVTDSLQLGNSADRPVGIGSVPVGTTPVGLDYDPNTDFADLAQNDSFRIEVGYLSGKKVSVRFSNNNVDEQFKINGIKVYYLPGSVYEQ